MPTPSRRCILCGASLRFIWTDRHPKKRPEKTISFETDNRGRRRTFKLLFLRWIKLEYFPNLEPGAGQAAPIGTKSNANDRFIYASRVVRAHHRVRPWRIWEMRCNCGSSQDEATTVDAPTPVAGIEQRSAQHTEEPGECGARRPLTPT